MEKKHYPDELLDKLSSRADEISYDELRSLHHLFRSEDGRDDIERWLSARWQDDELSDMPNLDGLMERVKARLTRSAAHVAAK